MKKLLVNVRGASASGKTTAVKQFCERYGFSVEKVETPFSTLPVSVINGGGIVVLGDYSADGNCLGVDRYKNGNKDIMDAIAEVANIYHPNIIVYEHMLSSHASKGTIEIAEMARLFGFEYLGIQLRLSEEKRLKNLLNRSGENASRKNFLRNNGTRIDGATQRLLSAGLNVVVAEVENWSKDEMWRILDGPIREALE